MTWSDRKATIICEQCGHHNLPEDSTWWQGEIIVCKDYDKCKKRQEVNDWVEAKEKDAENMSIAPEFPVIELPEKNPNKYQDKARQLVVDYYNHHLLEVGEEIHISQVYVVWFSKTLQNWKATVATDVSGDGYYFELTYNGDKKETYLNAYKKIGNEAIPDA